MHKVARGLAVWAAGALACAAAAQPAGYQEQESSRVEQVPAAGFWPTQRMIEFGIDRISEELAKQYALDQDQMWNARELIKERFPAWMQENRAELQTLLNQWVEATIAGEPPSAQDVAKWSDRFTPLFEEFTTLVDDTAEDMSTFMTEDQRILMDGELAAFHVGTRYMRNRLDAWRDGGYDWVSEWPRSEQFQKHEKTRLQDLNASQNQARYATWGVDTPQDATLPGAPPDAQADAQRATPAGAQRGKDEWAAYVEAFIRRYQLTEAQQNSAQRYLRQQTAQRDRYLQRRAPRIDELEHKLKTAQDTGEKGKLEAELAELKQPLDRMFDILKERLDRLPTRKQRAVAGPEPAGQPAATDHASRGESLKNLMEDRRRAAGTQAVQPAADETPPQ